MKYIWEYAIGIIFNENCINYKMKLKLRKSKKKEKMHSNIIKSKNINNYHYN